MGTGKSVQKNFSDYKNNERIGIYRQYQQNGRNLVEIARQLPNQHIYKEWSAGIQLIRSMNLLSQSIYLPQKYRFEGTGMCGSSGILYISFQRWESFLKDQIASRRKNNHFYTEEELWFILYNLSKLGKVYEPLRLKLGDLHPNNIVVTTQGFLKVVTRHSLPQQLTNFDKIVEEIKSDVYLAPEEMDEGLIEKGVYQFRYPERADTFSMGITMLEAGTLQNCTYLYIRNPLRISVQKFSSYKRILKERYSSHFSKIIEATLEVDHRHRMTMSKLYDILRPYQDLIEDLRPFSFAQKNDKNNMQHSYSMIPAQGSLVNTSNHLKVNRESNGEYASPNHTIFSFNKN